MDIQALKEQIESLDPKVHKALRDALAAEYSRLAGEGEGKPPMEKDSDPFAEMFDQAMFELNRRYIEGTQEYLQQHHPGLYQNMNETEDRLNEVWEAGLQGKADIEEFRKILKDWYFLWLQGIEMYSQEQTRQSNARKREDLL